MDQLRQRPQALLDLCPNHVWRWQPEDPLETFLDLLMLSHPANSTPQQPVNKHTETTTLGHRARCTIKRLDRHALAKNDTLLRDVYSLLRLYHYQNSALDLAHILDAENVQIWVAEQQTYNANQIVAALMLGIEGNIDQTLHEPIMARERRPAHQLLPQLLAQMANSPTALGERYARIIRIAVLPDSRRQAIGTQLLTELRQRLSNLDTPITTLGASFAGDTHSTQFWRANGYIEFHRGFRSNPRTGKRSVAVIRSDNQNVQRSIQQAVSILADNQDQLVKLDQANTFSGQLQVQATNQVTSLLEQHPVQQSTQPPTDLALLHRYVRGHRSAHDTAAALVRFCCLHNETALLSALKTTGVTADTHSPRPSRRSQESTLRKCIERHLFGQTGHGNEP